MNIFGIFGLMSFLKSMRPKPPIRPSRLSGFGPVLNELSDDLDYYINKFMSYRNRVR